MIEPEICFCDLNGLMDIEEDFLKSVVQEVLDKAMPELEFLQGYAKSNLIEKLQTLTQSHRRARDARGGHRHPAARDASVRASGGAG